MTRTKSSCAHYNLATHCLAHLRVGHVLVEHLHLGVDVLLLLIFVQRAVVPHEKSESGVELANIVHPSHPLVSILL